MYEEVYINYIDTAGNYHWTGTYTGAHILPKDCLGKCDRCAWKYNGGCSEWKGIKSGNLYKK